MCGVVTGGEKDAVEGDAVRVRRKRGVGERMLRHFASSGENAVEKMAAGLGGGVLEQIVSVGGIILPKRSRAALARSGDRQGMLGALEVGLTRLVSLFARQPWRAISSPWRWPCAGEMRYCWKVPGNRKDSHSNRAIEAHSEHRCATTAAPAPAG